MQSAPLAKLILLSIVLAVGFLLIVLSCALFHNWWPILVLAMFLMAPIPNAICSSLTQFYESDFLSDSAGPNSVAEFGHFLTGFLLVSGTALPILLHHVALISQWSLLMSICGGVLIYTSIITFGWFFKPYEEDYDF